MYLMVDNKEETALYDLSKARTIYLDKKIHGDIYTLIIEWPSATSETDSFNVLYHFEGEKFAKYVFCHLCEKITDGQKICYFDNLVKKLKKEFYDNEN